MAHVAFYTFGILRASRGDEQVKGFFDRIPGAFAQAATTPGHIGTYQEEIDRAICGPRFFVPDVHTAAPQTLSLWENLGSVLTFAYSGQHAEALRHRKEWFLPPEWPTYAIWWLGDDETPTYDDARTRLEHLHDHGPTPFAFDFKSPFDAEGRSVRLARMQPSGARSHATE